MDDQMFPTLAYLTQLSAVVQPLPGSADETGRKCRRRWVANAASGKRALPYGRNSSSSSGNGTGTGSSAHQRKRSARAAVSLSCPQYWSSIGDCDHTDEGEALDTARPQFSFTCLIGLAVLSSEQKQLSVVQIYEYIVRNFPYYKTAKGTWRNSVRHVLSLGKFFQKPKASALVRGGGGRRGGGDLELHVAKGGSWELVPNMFGLLIEHIAEGQQRLPAATARHLGLPTLKRKGPTGKFSSRIGKGRPHSVHPPQHQHQHQHQHEVVVVPQSNWLHKLVGGPGSNQQLVPVPQQQVAAAAAAAVPLRLDLDLDELSTLALLRDSADSPSNFDSDEGLGDSFGSNYSSSGPPSPADVSCGGVGGQEDTSAVDDWQNTEAMLASVFRELDATTAAADGGTSSSAMRHPVMQTFAGTVY